MEPLTGWPSEVLFDLEQIVLRVARHRYVNKFFIGRTSHPERRKFQLASDGVISIYKTENGECAQDVESYLVELFHNHPKCKNGSVQNGGDLSLERLQYVVVAVWLAG